jgi:hypothetical protein
MKSRLICAIVLLAAGIQGAFAQQATGASLNSNVFEQVRYADQFQWSQKPAGAISVGVNTVTINSIRGISEVSVEPGLLGTYHVIHKLRISGSGKPEIVTLTGTTCTGSSSGTCKITFTATSAHAEGYTIGTATAGFQEANVDCFGQYNGTNPTTTCVIKGSPYTVNGHFIFYATFNLQNISGSGGNVILSCEGATLEDGVSGAAMILYGGGSWIGPEHGTIRDCHFAAYPGIGRAGNGTQIYVWDKGQNLAMRNNTFNGYINPNDVLDTMIQVSADQGFVLDHNDFNDSPVKCDTAWCGPLVYGDASHGAAIGNISNNNFSTGTGSAIDWVSGNGLTLSSNVFQNWNKYPWRYSAGYQTVTDNGGNYYEGNPRAINPDFGVPNYGAHTGRQVGISGSVVEYHANTDRGAALGVLRFTTTGKNLYSYYIVGNDGSGHSTRPLFIGDAATDGTTTFVIRYLKFNAATYDVLRAGPKTQDGTDAAPWGTGNWAVATGQVCTANPCAFTETFAPPKTYTVRSEFQSSTYTPKIDYWPVPLFLNNAGIGPAVYIGPGIDGFVSTSSQSGYFAYYDAIFTSEPSSGGAVTGMHILHLNPLEAGGGPNANPGALILNPDGQTVGMFNRKGRINMPSLSQTNRNYLNLHDNMLYQTFDSASAKTLATPGHQPLLDGDDCGMGYDKNASYLAFMCGNPISFYVNHKFDSGASKIFQILSTGLLINKGISPSSGSGYQAIRTVAGCATTTSSGATCTTTVTWTSAFADANYTPHCDGLEIASGVPLNGGIAAKTAASVTFQTVAATAKAAQFKNVVCSAIHD